MLWLEHESVERRRQCKTSLVWFCKSIVPLTDCGGLLGCEMLRIPHCLENRLIDGGKVASPTHRLKFTAQDHYFSAYGTHFY
jgi:hypothetical protein